MEKKKSKGKELSEKLYFTPKNIADLQPDVVKESVAFCEDYKAFMNRAKTEREFVREAQKLLCDAGYVPYEAGKRYQAGDKVYFNNRGKALIMTTFGTQPVAHGVHINIAHIDSPRLDLKANPLYEDGELALFKTHYYGGIRKYQWTAIPLSIHGIFAKADGTVQEFAIGEEESDPVFCVTDLLPHLGNEQDKRPLGNGITGEELNILVGSLPYEDDELKERVKLFTMQLLNEKYGITEKDFICAEIEVVPAFRARDLGFDRSMVGAYAHDDKVCAYTALRAELAVTVPQYTTVTCFADKEET
ncbi:MAG: aminopeptidase, partial [Christensenella sp.]